MNLFRSSIRVKGRDRLGLEVGLGVGVGLGIGLGVACKLPEGGGDPLLDRLEVWGGVHFWKKMNP